ncbi:hypothetical protein HZB58_01295 [Candidatus Gottesmanbacteria bacterium]|nr:hypothetical protein [Candidatus Gottesmanbacteria bacterium]
MINVERIGQVHIRMPIIDQFSGLRIQIQKTVIKSIEKTKQFIPLHETTIRIKNDPHGVIKDHAHGGWTLTPESILIKVNSNFPDKEQFLQVELPRSVSHELHHAVREKALKDEPRSLGRTLIFEGLATYFETEVWGGEPSKWADALTHEQLQELLKVAINELSDNAYDHSRWFFGTKDLPRWTGYTIGLYLIKEYLKLHPDQTAASLVTTPASVILGGLKESILSPVDPQQ